MKNIDKDCLYNLPSGASYYPSRLIHKDGTLMWKHALLFRGELNVPSDVAHEAHIIKTAQRLEELNSWLSNDLDVWQCLCPTMWYSPTSKELSTGYTVYFKHSFYDLKHTYDCLASHILPHESLKRTETDIRFQRC